MSDDEFAAAVKRTLAFLAGNRPGSGEPCICLDIPDCTECTLREMARAATAAPRVPKVKRSNRVWEHGPAAFMPAPPVEMTMDLGEREARVPAVRQGLVSGYHADRIITDDIKMHPEPADRRIIAWMPVEYMEAARAAQGEPDALQIALSLGCWYCGSRDPCGCREEADSAIWGADASKPVDLACACPDCVDGPEAKPEPECGVWLISPSSLPGCMRNGAQDGKGKAKGREMVYDFEEVP